MDALFSGIVALAILFVDGLVFGIVVRKGLAAVFLVIIGLLLASFVGLGIPFLSLDSSHRVPHFQQPSSANF